MVTASALAALALPFCHNFGWRDPSSLGKSEHSAYAASPSYLSCAWLLPTVSPCVVPCQATGTSGPTHCCHQPWSIHWCCLWPQPIYTLFMALPSQPVCESLSCRGVKESHTGCVHLSSGVWSVGCLCNHRSPISMDTAAGGKGQLLCHQCLLVSVGLALWPSQAWPFKSQCWCFAESPVL